MENDHSKVEQIIKKLEYGTGNEKIEAITHARRKADDFFIQLVFGDEKKTQILREVSRIESFSTEEKDKIKKALIDIVSSGKDVLACWYSTIVLVELGHLSEEILDDFWKISNQLIEWLMDESSGGALTLSGMRLVVQDETMRALSEFKEYPSVGEKVKDCYEKKAPLGVAQAGLRKQSLYSFGAIGNEKYRELVEYNAEQGEDDVKKAGKAALELWGTGSYDEIKKLAESRSKKGPCFIATEVYGSPIANEVLFLKDYRDLYLSKHRIGRWFIKGYYSLSPSMTGILRKRTILKQMVKILIIDPLIRIIDIFFSITKGK